MILSLILVSCPHETINTRKVREDTNLGVRNNNPSSTLLDQPSFSHIADMSEKPFKIYKSSAGSGKTYTLVREYLRLALAWPTYY